MFGFQEEGAEGDAEINLFFQMTFLFQYQD